MNWQLIDEDMKQVGRGNGRPPVKGDYVIIGDGDDVTHEVVARAWRCGKPQHAHHYPEAECDVFVVSIGKSK